MSELAEDLGAALARTISALEGVHLEAFSTASRRLWPRRGQLGGSTGERWRTGEPRTWSGARA